MDIFYKRLLPFVAQDFHLLFSFWLIAQEIYPCLTDIIEMNDISGDFWTSRDYFKSLLLLIIHCLLLQNVICTARKQLPCQVCSIQASRIKVKESLRQLWKTNRIWIVTENAKKSITSGPNAAVLQGAVHIVLIWHMKCFVSLKTIVLVCL